MTTKGKGYDPYAFGQVKLGAGKQESGGSPEDVLFAEPAAPVAGGPDTSWDPPEQFQDSSSAEPAAVATKPAAAVAARPAAPKPVAERPSAESGIAPAAKPETAPARTSDSAARKATAQQTVRATPPVGMPEREPAGPAAVAVPFAILLVVESAATWLWLGQQNPVLGGLAAVLGVGLAALGWCALRR